MARRGAACHYYEKGEKILQAVDNVQVVLAMVIYMLIVIGIGFFYARRAGESTANFLIGGRKIGPWITALGAEASDMSGWLLMGLPGVAYFFGLAEAIWTAIGLLIGTYLNWLFVAKRLRSYSVVAGNAITIPDFFSNRFKEEKKVVMAIVALFILVFFTVYASSCLVAMGKLFSSLFGVNYQLMMILGAVFVLFYTFIGGFLAESASDFMQGTVMIVALVVVFLTGTSLAGGVDAIVENIKDFPGFLEFFGLAQPVMEDGVQVVADNKPLFGAAGSYGFLAVISTLAWGLGYFGMPQVLLKFMAIRDPNELTLSRRVATIWCAISLAAAVGIGLMGRALYPTVFLTPSSAENIFILLSTKFFPPFLAGLVMSGNMAATNSYSYSCMLIEASTI